MNIARYTATAKTLHWLIALLILGLLPLGLYMADLPLSPLKLKLYSYHKWAGMTALALVALRILWRIGHQPPPLPSTQAPWQRSAAHLGHFLLYVLMLAVPLSGWLMTSAKGFPVVWFGVLQLPDLVAKDKELGDLLELVHSSLNYALMALIAIHILAALKHQWIDRDGTLTRMLPSFKEK